MSRREKHDWLARTNNISITTFSEHFHYVNRDQAYIDFRQLILDSHVKTSIKDRCLQEFESWKANESRADLFWLGRQSDVAVQKGKSVATANLIEAATSDLPSSIKNVNNGSMSRIHPPKSIAASTATQLDSAGATSNSLPSGVKARKASASVSTSKPPVGSVINSPVSSSSSSSSTSPSPATKKRRALYCTEEPWHSLMMSLIKIINGQNNVSIPQTPANMKYIHRELFNHAVSLLKEYQAQCGADKDNTLIKDAQVVMSCLLNTMSPRVVGHFTESNDEELISNAIFHTKISGFETHECLEFIKCYAPVVKERGVPYLRRKLVVDRGKLLGSFLQDADLPRSAIMQDKVLMILTHLCDFIEKPPFGSAAPSENDCLQLWSYVFGTIVNKVTVHSGDKILSASKVLRLQQACEYGDVSEAGRKVDLIFMYNDIELSNIEFKRTDISSRDIAVQCRKNIRLGRCIQEVHAANGHKGASVIMGDVAGYVGLFYQVKPMQEVSIAGKTAASMVYLPSTPGAMEAFLEGTSLAMIWNFVEFLEDQGPKIARARERHQLELEKMRFSDAIGSPRAVTPPPTVKKYENNVTFSPTRKRVYNTSVD